MSKSIAVLSLFALLAIASAHEFAGTHTVELTAANYDEKTGDGKVYMIAYFAPWCGHCKRLAPSWTEMATKLADNKNVAVAYIDCTAHREICSDAGVKGYPTIKVLHKNEEYKAYKGARDIDSLSSFLLDAAKDLTSEV
mmetsp:Transcript_74594/g.150874  ORF Transcript_74594/g.150874 Transcript_74594/m.150874 type:complete len:139 (+) Transcript_74594:41-457(+)